MIKHVGKHNNKKLVLLWRQVPGEAHLALVAYSDTLPRLIHDEVMKCLESAVGQNAKDLSDVLFRTVMADGRNALEVLHREGDVAGPRRGVDAQALGEVVHLDLAHQVDEFVGLHGCPPSFRESPAKAF